MRVLLIAGEYPPMEGGVGDYTRLLAEALAAQGTPAAPIEVHVLTSARAEMNDDRTAPVVRHALMRAWGFRPLYATVARLQRDLAPEIIHIQYQAACYGLHPAINLLPRWLRLTARAHTGVRPHSSAACVTTFHDLLTPYLFPKAGGVRWRSVLAMARGSHASIVTNVQDEQRLEAAGGVPLLARIPIGSNVPCVLPDGYDRGAWRRRWGVPDDALLLCYFGFLNASKGGDELIEALERVVRAGIDAHLLFVGGAVGASDATNSAYWSQVQGSIAARGLAERVHTSGFLLPEEVSASLCCADLCVLPYRDGASFRRGSLLAALEHGLAIVSTTPQVEVPELRDGENTLLTAPNDAAALSAAILRLAGDAPLRARLGAGARALSRRFGWEQIAARTLEVYHALLD